jgi:hypothetical protein
VTADEPQTTPDWFGDPDATHEPFAEPTGAGFRPACSCGFRAPLTHDTEDGAMRAARVHVACSTPQPPPRYMADMNGDDTVVFCVQHPNPPLIVVAPPPNEHQTEIAQAVQAHEREFHGDGSAG